MRNPYNYSDNDTTRFGIELVRTNKTIAEQKITIDALELKAAMYKANFFHKYDLAEKLQKQIEENYDYCIGEWDGFCFASWRARAIYRTLDDMYEEGLITSEEYKSCIV
jgi:hypothetical protein